MLGATAETLLNSLEGVCYVVDEEGTLVSAGRENWNAFADANGWLTGDAVGIQGRNLFDMVAGQSVRDAAERLHRSVVARRRPANSYGYRCDSPEQKREMRMSLT